MNVRSNNLCSIYMAWNYRPTEPPFLLPTVYEKATQRVIHTSREGASVRLLSWVLVIEVRRGLEYVPHVVERAEVGFQ